MAGGWDQASLAAAFRTMAMTPPPPTDWAVDSDASYHTTSTEAHYLAPIPPTPPPLLWERLHSPGHLSR
jgi:hypothetical protein